jgi:hypothetical protein
MRTSITSATADLPAQVASVVSAKLTPQGTIIFIQKFDVVIFLLCNNHHLMYLLRTNPPPTTSHFIFICL